MHPHEYRHVSPATRRISALKQREKLLESRIKLADERFARSLVRAIYAFTRSVGDALRESSRLEPDPALVLTPQRPGETSAGHAARAARVRALKRARGAMEAARARGLEGSPPSPEPGGAQGLGAEDPETDQGLAPEIKNITLLTDEDQETINRNKGIYD